MCSKWKEMVMLELVQPMDALCNAGVILNQESHTEVPFFLVDYGVEGISLDSTMVRYRKLILDFHPTDGGKFTYVITSDRIVAELTSKSVERALNGPAEDILHELTRSGIPEYSVTYDVEARTHERFSRARDACSGGWLLVLLTSDALLLALDRDGTVIEMWKNDRAMFDEVQ